MNIKKACMDLELYFRGGGWGGGLDHPVNFRFTTSIFIYCITNKNKLFPRADFGFLQRMMQCKTTSEKFLD